MPPREVKGREMKKTECLLCKGTGKIAPPSKLRSAELKNRAILILSKNGYGVREIQRLLGYKSPRSVGIVLEKHEA